MLRIFALVQIRFEEIILSQQQKEKSYKTQKDYLI